MRSLSLALTEDGLGSVSADGIFRPGNGLGLPHDVAAAEIFVSDDGLLTFVDDEGAVLTDAGLTAQQSDLAGRLWESDRPISNIADLLGVS